MTGSAVIGNVSTIPLLSHYGNVRPEELFHSSKNCCRMYHLFSALLELRIVVLRLPF